MKDLNWLLDQLRAAGPGVLRHVRECPTYTHEGFVQSMHSARDLYPEIIELFRREMSN